MSDLKIKVNEKDETIKKLSLPKTMTSNIDCDV